MILQLLQYCKREWPSGPDDVYAIPNQLLHKQVQKPFQSQGKQNVLSWVFIPPLSSALPFLPFIFSYPHYLFLIYPLSPSYLPYLSLISSSPYLARISRLTTDIGRRRRRWTATIWKERTRNRTFRYELQHCPSDCPLLAHAYDRYHRSSK